MESIYLVKSHVRKIILDAAGLARAGQFGHCIEAVCKVIKDLASDALCSFTRGVTGHSNFFLEGISSYAKKKLEASLIINPNPLTK